MKGKLYVITIFPIILFLLALFLWKVWGDRSADSEKSTNTHEVVPDERISRIHMEASGIALSIMLYNRAFGEFPKGNCSDIGGALVGENPLNIVFSTFSRVGDNGAFLDPYGIPYDISFTDHGYIRIRSAGKNKVEGDADDEVLEDNGIQSEEWWRLMESAIEGSEIEQGWKRAVERSQER